jgi:ribosomal protein S18 acetylase RimI-like enzyme
MTASSLELLDNIVWHTLAGPHARFSTGDARVRRYAAGYSPLLGARVAEQPDFDGIAAHCRAGEQLYLGGWTGTVPAGWQLDVDSTMEQYVWIRPSPDDTAGEVALGPANVPAMLGLVELTHPGPFAERTIELGEYWGLFEGGRLIAMAGERMHAGSLREVSAVCAHPDFQGRGLARRVMSRVIRSQLARGQTPFLHVMSGNASARALYERMGFRHHQTVAVRALTYLGR